MRVPFHAKILVPGLIIFLLVQTTSAQKLSDELGAIKTSFTISTSEGDLPVISQSIIKRAYHFNKQDEDTAYDGQSAYGYSYGMQSLHLEFVTSSDVSEIYHEMKRTRIKYYEVMLIGEDNKVLFVTRLYDREVKKGINEDGLFAFSVSLHSIPLLLLDITKEINVTRIRTYK